MLQELIVALIVVAAVAYMAWRYLPAAWRQRLGRVHPGLAAGPGGCGSGFLGRYVVQQGDTADALVAGLKSSLTSNGLSDTDFTLTLSAGQLEVANNTNEAAAISASATRGTGGLSGLNSINVVTDPATALQDIEGMLKT